jgi:hypothetical protein
MAKDVEIKIKVVNESGDIIEKTAKSMDDLEKSVSSLSKELANAPLGSAKFKELDSALKDNQKTLDKTKASTMGLGEKLSSIGGPIGGVVQGFMGMGKAAMAFVANPIGAVIAVIGVVVTALTKALGGTEKGFNSMNKITAIFGEIIDPIIGLVEDLAALLAGGLASALEFVGSLMGGAAAEAGNLADATAKLGEAEKNAAVDRAKTNQKLAETKEILSDTNAKYEDRVAALKKVQEVEGAQAKQEIANATENLRIAKALYTAHDDDLALRDKMREAEIKLAEVQQNAAAQQRTFNKQEKSLASEKDAQDKQLAADKKARRDKAAAEEKTRRDNAVAGEKAARDKQVSYDEAYTLSLIKNEEERARLQLKFAQEREQRELQAQIDLIQKKKTISKAEDKQLDQLLATQISLFQKQGAELKALTDKQAEDKKRRQDQANLADLDAQIKAGDQRYLILQDQVTKEGYLASIQMAEVKKRFDEGLIEEGRYRYEIEQIQKIATKATDKLYQDDHLKRVQETADANDKLLEQGKITSAQRLALLEEENATADKLFNINKAQQIDYGNGLIATQIAIVDSAAITEAQHTAIIEENEKKRQKIQKETFDLRVQQTQGVLTAATDIAGAVQAVNEAQMARELKGAGDNFEAQEKIKKEFFEKNKKVQIAQAIISTLQGAIGAFTSLSVIPVVGPVLGAIAAAAALVSGYANVDKIKSTQYVGGTAPGGGGGGGSAPPPAPSMFAGGGYVSGTGTGTSDSIPARLSNGESVINANSTAQFGGLLSLINEAGGGRSFAEGGVSNGNMNTPVIKTYVVASDMTSQQEADFRIKQVARL